MKYFIIYILGILVIFHSTVCVASILKFSEFKTSKENPALMPGELSFEQTYSLGRETNATVTVEITAKGNGIMRILNVKIPVCDMHNDGDIFRNGLLNVDLVDIDGDGYKDMIVYGILDHTDDKSGVIVSSESVIAVYHYDPSHKLLILRFVSGPDVFKNGL